MFNLKRLGASFGITFLAGLASGQNKRTAFRTAGVGALLEQTYEAKPDLAHAVELVAKSAMLERQIDQPVELTQVATNFRPNSAQYNQSSTAIERLIQMDTVELLELDQQLHEFEEGIEEIRGIIYQTRLRKDA